MTHSRFRVLRISRKPCVRFLRIEALKIRHIEEAASVQGRASFCRSISTMTGGAARSCDNTEKVVSPTEGIRTRGYTC